MNEVGVFFLPRLGRFKFKVRQMVASETAGSPEIMWLEASWVLSKISGFKPAPTWDDCPLEYLDYL